MELTQKNKTLKLNNRKPLRSVTRAEHRQSLLSEDVINLSVESTEPIAFFVGDSLVYEERKYTLNAMPKVQRSQGLYVYDLTLEGLQYALRDKVYFNLDAQGFQTTADFPLTGNLERFLSVLLLNLNRLNTFRWQLGTYPEQTETKTLTFSHENCLAVLQRLCKEYNTEFLMEQNIRENTCTLHLKKIGKTLNQTFEYGKGNGLYTLTRENVNEEIVTRLYVYGSTENLKTDYRDYSQRLKLPQSYGTEYIEEAEKVSLYGLKEGVKLFEEIKPTFKGIVSSVGTLENGIQTFSVAGMDFDLNAKEESGTLYLLPDTPAKVHFNTGNLAGYTFELAKNGGYTHSTKTFKIKQITDERGQKFPEENGAFSLAKGDEFTLLDIAMPERYVQRAEQKLLDAALREYEKQSVNNIQYSLDLDPLFLKQNKLKNPFKIGDYVRVVDTTLGVDKVSRIMRLRRDLLAEYNYKITIADTYEVSFIANVLAEIKETQTVVQRQAQLEKKVTGLGWKLNQDLLEGVFDEDGYFNAEKIKPLSIETKMLSVGSPLQQFDLFDVVIYQGTLGNLNDVIFNTAGTLVHYTVESAPKTWNIREGYFPPKARSPYYLYARCQRNGNRGSIYPSTEKIGTLSDPNYYYFEVGYISALKDNNVRKIRLTTGFTGINGGEITTGRIISRDGNNWIDIKENEIEINAKVQFTRDSPAYNQLKSYIDQAVTNISVESGNIDRAILDGVVTEAEAKSIAISLENLTTDFTQNLSRAEKILQQAYDTELSHAKSAYESSFNALKTYIQSAIADKKVTESEKQTIHQKFEDYRLKARTLFIAMEKVTGDRIALANSNAQEAKNLAKELKQQINDIATSESGIEQAVLDGIVTKAEAKSIFMSLENLKTGYQEKVAQVRKIIGGNAAGNYYSAFDPMEDLYTIFFAILYEANVNRSLAEEEKTKAIDALNAYIVELDALRNAKIKVYTENIKNEQDKNTETARITREFSTRKTELTSLKNTLANYLSDNQISNAESNDFNTKLNRLSYLHTEFKTDVTTKTQNDTIVMNLKTIYEAFKRSFKNLYDYIVSAIADEKATETERQKIKNKFSDYREKTNTLAEGVENLNWNYRKMAEVANNRAEKLENVTDFLTTTIDGDTISTGVLQVGGLTSDGQSQANAGVSGTVETDNQTDVRFWAGSTYANRKTAPFRVLENGELYSTAGEIGGFTIAEEYLQSGQEEAEHLKLSRSGIEFESPNLESAVTLGANYVNAHAIPFLLSAKNTQTSSKAIGLSVNVPPNLYTPEHIKRLALDLTGNSEIRGAIYQLGTSAVFEKGYIGMAFNDTLKTHFKNTHSFVFTSIINSEVVVELPNKEDVRQATGITEVSFELKILVTKRASGGIILQGTGETKILDQDANPAFGNGKIGMGRGDSIILRYAEGDYYVINLNR